MSTGGPFCDVHGMSPCGCTPEERAHREAINDRIARYAKMEAEGQQAEVTRLVTAEERERARIEEVTEEAHAEAEAILAKALLWLRQRGEHGIRTSSAMVVMVFENGEHGVITPLRGLDLCALIGANERATRIVHAHMDHLQEVADEILPPKPDEVPPA
jgi:hypothetical protein